MWGVRESESRGVGESGSRGVRESGSRGVKESGSQGVGESASFSVIDSFCGLIQLKVTHTSRLPDSLTRQPNLMCLNLRHINKVPKCGKTRYDF